MASVSRVAIVGGGVGGMALAVALSRAGISVHVIEKARPEDQLGTGINLQNNALRALEGLGVLDDCLACGDGWNTVTNCDSSGAILHQVTLPWPQRPGMPGALGIMRTDFADILARHARSLGAELSYQTTVEQLEQKEACVLLTLSNGRTGAYDVVVAADGVYSSLRRQVFGDTPAPTYAGQGVWRYTAPRPSNREGFTLFRSPTGETVGCLPLSSEHCYYFYLESSPSKHRFEPSELPGALAERLAVFNDPDIRAAVASIGEGRHISYRPFDVLLMPQPWHRGRVVLIGDAAHSLTPQLTSGGGMAIEDAVVLAEELSRDVAAGDALTAYGQRREARVRAIYENSYRICELEKAKSPDGTEGTRLMIESFSLLGTPY